MGAAALIFTSSAMATCPPILPCKTTAEASTIAGSNADQKLITFTQTITTTTNETAQALVDMATANASSLNTGAQTIVAAQAELSQTCNHKIKIRWKLRKKIYTIITKSEQHDDLDDAKGVCFLVL